MTYIFIKRTLKFKHSGEIRNVGSQAGFIDADDHPIVYIEDYVGFDIADNISDEAVTNGLTQALSNQLGVSNPVFAHTLNADHDEYADKREELIAKYNGTHPDRS